MALSAIERRLVHRIPGGWQVRGFDRWACGAPAFSHESGSRRTGEVTCAACLRHIESCAECRATAQTDSRLRELAALDREE